MVFPEETTITIGDGENQRSRNIPRIRLFPEESKEEKFIIFVKPYETDKTFNQMKISKYLISKHKDIEMWFINKNRMKIACNSAKTANEILTDKEIILDYNLTINFNKSEVKGKIPVPTDYSEKDLYENLKSYDEFSGEVDKIKIVEVRRFFVYKNEKKEDIDTVLITFEGSKIPSHVILDHLRIPVYIYVNRVLQCKKCWNYGHSFKACRAKERCVGCGLRTKEKHECEYIKCVNCHDAHKSNDSRCPVYIYRLGVEKEKARKTIQKPEEAKVNNVPDIVNENEFPALNVSRTQKRLNQNIQLQNKLPTIEESEVNETQSARIMRKRKTADRVTIDPIDEFKYKMNKSIRVDRKWAKSLALKIKKNSTEDTIEEIEMAVNNKISELLGIPSEMDISDAEI